MRRSVLELKVQTCYSSPDLYSAGSVASNLVPTVERENLDLQNRHIADYNRELLSVAGIVSRCVYDSEMAEIARLWKDLGSTPDTSEGSATEWLLRRASHLLQFFTFRTSTPIAEVGSVIQASFFSCNTREFLVASSKGILPASKVRLPVAELSFLGGLSIVPENIAKENTLLLDQLQERNLIRSVTIEDIIDQLNEKPLTIEEAVALLKWWISLSWNASYDSRILARLRDAALISWTDSEKVDRIVPLSTIKHFVNSKSIPPEVPLPQNILPVSHHVRYGWLRLLLMNLALTVPSVERLACSRSGSCLRMVRASSSHLDPVFM
jgi:hypothetical protein